MGTKNNVNPDHYKEDGRERPGQDINQEINKQKFAQSQNAERIGQAEGRSKFIPGGARPITEMPEKDLAQDTGQTIESANSSSKK
jgi:hypothetical protein